jgi:hypothetical protein
MPTIEPINTTVPETTALIIIIVVFERPLSEIVIFGYVPLGIFIILIDDEDDVPLSVLVESSGGGSYYSLLEDDDPFVDVFVPLLP